MWVVACICVVKGLGLFVVYLLIKVVWYSIFKYHLRYIKLLISKSPYEEISNSASSLISWVYHEKWRIEVQLSEKPVSIRSWQVWHDGCILKSGLWLDAWDLWLGRGASLDYIKGVSNVRYKLKPSIWQGQR